MSKPAKTIAILYPGELGAALARSLRDGGHTLITTLDGRSAETARRCREAGIFVRDGLRDVVSEAEIVLSIVPPAAAEQVAAQYVRLAHLAPADAVYADINSIGPELAMTLARQIQDAGRSFV